MEEDTLFTKIIRGEIPSSKVAEGETWYAFLDINPHRTGHTLVVPKEQAQRIAELSPGSRRDLLEGVTEVQRRLSIEFETSDFSVNVNDGPLAGQEVPHVHLHVIPRVEGGSSRPMWSHAGNPSSTQKIEPDFEALAALATRLQSH